ncbi:GlsB/YeaQ/YmgE family stress response membrane protein [Ornithinimicrobium humiphilum]|uniref:Putative membrane protein YeaQ/YmgE (Transglycosylase-associated protein family) n=2 Tax=Ornithinimicrobium humiphilum TaxID=125288 RepID=A0A543KQZ8_9MICO|nr:putative membrane protein YeaQ/YmgE (transglycosylase-associated protein family) [Ornithinimicrobium humiphilum]
MVWTIIVALIVGCIVGPLARLILPGKQNISVPMTVVLGAVGALVGSWLGATLFGGESGDPWSWSGFILGTVVAIVAVLIYGAITGRRDTAGRIG